MIPRLLTALLLVVLSTSSMAETPNNIAALCKKQWSGDKGLQSFCIKEKRNYQNWLKHVRKRVYADPSQRSKIDGCIRKHKPDYRGAYDCVFESSWLKIELF